ncbi:3(2),5-bisphosphate nucleotidase HAL2 [Macrolepiota fuliginosa MF-IS2]|uniref:3'(2'),5'-bisphosphate nucleotidase n=1 Tax=Macrolepiota fuliginosa MF-IS2 TaxID=1400762 RepID=A0A9P5XE57_9AGAR|nr:3(2),5-bisphosphate nucleotidase HAL2 [Macrolepiota fuliginosa MF-IS2]
MIPLPGQPVLPYNKERTVAISAVRRACIVTQKVFETLVNTEFITKGDESPVTVGDFAAQAVISAILGNVFPEDPIVGEEDAVELRKNKDLSHRITALVNEGLTDERLFYEKEEWGIGQGYDIAPREVNDAIDKGKFEGGNEGRMWTIDPIDGTKGFLRGEQYAVCLSLIVDGKPTVGVIGCPNLPHRTGKPEVQKGYIFVAVKEQGSERLTMQGYDPTIIAMPTVHPSDLVVLESVESGHSLHSFNARVSELLTVEEPPCRMDSQAKYCALAMGRGHLYLRMPTRSDYEEKIWDHAPGTLLVEEAGGIVTNSKGGPLNFGLGRTLGKNSGILACGSWVYPKVLDAVRVASRESRKRAKSREAIRAAAAAASTPPPNVPLPPPPAPDKRPVQGDDKENRPEADVKL